MLSGINTDLSSGSGYSANDRIQMKEYLVYRCMDIYHHPVSTLLPCDRYRKLFLPPGHHQAQEKISIDPLPDVKVQPLQAYGNTRNCHIHWNSLAETQEPRS